MKIMKKLFAMLLALALLFTCAAFAEDAEDEGKPIPENAKVYDGVWKCDQATIEMFWELEGFKVLVHKPTGAQEATEWEYSCDYQEKDHSVVADGLGSRTDFVYDEAGDIKSYKEAYNDGEATFTLDAEGRLLWHDAKEDAGKDMLFVKEQKDPFEGVWVCGRASMEVVFEEEGYKVFISWSSSAAEHTEWEYSCHLNAETNTLESMPFGTRTDIVFGDDGEIAASKVIYEDGEATFTLDEEGHLLWHDAKEDAGKDMAFEWVEIVSVDVG